MACLGCSTHHPQGYLLALLLSASALLWSDFAQALSIGKPQFDSGLSQALRVRIPIRGFDPGTRLRDYAISALPSSEYAKLGLATPSFPLHQLSFRWLNETSSGAEILISSEQRITEPVINILLEVRGPTRRWVKQVDLLLDPPTLGPVPVVSSNRTAPRQPSSARGNPSDQYGPVQAGEVLSVIAQKVRPDPKIPLVQMVQAIIDVNPKAFPAGPQSLRAGTVLQVPQRREIERATLNKQLMQPIARAAAKQKPTVAKAGATPPFLPDYRYANGAMYPLTMLFLSYEAIKPVDLKPHLISLEQSEPLRFKADWTLNQAPISSTPSRFLSPTHSSALEEVQESKSQDDVAENLMGLKRSESNTEAQNDAGLVVPSADTAESSSNSPLLKAEQKPKSTAQAASVQTTPPEPPNNNEEPRWWLWLVGVVATLLLYRWQQNRPAARQDIAPRIPYTKQTSHAPLHPPIKAAEAKPQSPAPSLDEPSTGSGSATPDAESDKATDEYAVSEQEQQQLRRDIRAMLNANLPSEAERKLKIAEALAERGNHSRAKQMVTEVQDSLSKM